MKTEVYSWRLSSELKSDIEREARARRTGISAILDMAVRAWLERNRNGESDDQRQAKLHAMAARYFGVLAANDTGGAENVRRVIRQRLRKSYAR